MQFHSKNEFCIIEHNGDQRLVAKQFVTNFQPVWYFIEQVTSCKLCVTQQPKYFCTEYKKVDDVLMLRRVLLEGALQVVK